VRVIVPKRNIGNEHKASTMPREEFKREVIEILYFKAYKSQLPARVIVPGGLEC
jgi:hypothetical protein